MYSIKPTVHLLLLALLYTLGCAASWKSTQELTVAKSSYALQVGDAATGNLASQYGPLAVTAAKKAVMEQLPEAASEAAIWAVNNPGFTAGVVFGAVGVFTLAAPATVALPVLSTAGFGAGGVEAGSAAALIHGTIGNVALGSAFATAQSAAAGGTGIVMVAAVTQIFGGVAAAAGGGLAYMKAIV